MPYEEWTHKKPYIGYMKKIGNKVIALKRKSKE